MRKFKAKISANSSVELIATLKEFQDGSIELDEVLEVLDLDDIDDIEVISEIE